MKGSKVYEKGVKILSGLKFNYLKEDDSDLGRVDFGVLTVAMMIAALDGEIKPDEFKAFSKLADGCRVSKGERAARYNAALHSAGYMLLMARSGISAKALSLVFLDEAERVLPAGFAGGRTEDVRRALVLWISMGLADGEFSGNERACVKAFCSRVAEIMKKRRDCKRERLWFGLSPISGGSCLREENCAKDADAERDVDLMAQAEKVVVAGDLAAIRKFILDN